MVLAALVLIFVLEFLLLAAAAGAAHRRTARRGHAAGTSAPRSALMEQMKSLQDGPETE